MLNELAPMVEKLSVRLWFIEAIAVIIPINAIMPSAIIVTVIPVRSLLLFMVRKASERESVNCIVEGTSSREFQDNAKLIIKPVNEQARYDAEDNN